MQGWLLWFALTAAFSLMGVGMASWQSGMEVGGPITTAHTGLEFTGCWTDIISPQPDGQESAKATANFNNDGVDGSKNIDLLIENAYPGLQVEFSYEIKNTGSLPLRKSKADPPVITLEDGISEYQPNNTPERIEVNQMGTGTIFIMVDDDVNPDSTYSFTMKIKYEPDIPTNEN